MDRTFYLATMFPLVTRCSQLRNVILRAQMAAPVLVPTLAPAQVVGLGPPARTLSAILDVKTAAPALVPTLALALVPGPVPLVESIEQSWNRMVALVSILANVILVGVGSVRCPQLNYV